eukprot:6898194-Pyramimonas_sp.AAC.1
MTSAATPSITAEIESKVNGTGKVSKPHRDSSQECNAVVGGLGDCFDFDAAGTFLKEQFARLQAPEYIDIF